MRWLRQMHEASPLHAFMGGGDQLYNDGLWGVPALKAWLGIEDTKVGQHHFFLSPAAIYTS
jgi:hypothetical protein